MDEYLYYTKAFIGIIQSSLSEEELERSKKAGMEMVEAITNISEKYQLSVREMLNTTLGIHEAILETIQEQLDK